MYFTGEVRESLKLTITGTPLGAQSYSSKEEAEFAKFYFSIRGFAPRKMGQEQS